jgi:hypothetical protein
MRTISYGLVDIQWARILLALIVCAILAVALAPTPLLSTAPHLPPGPCGGGVATHC